MQSGFFSCTAAGLRFGLLLPIKVNKEKCRQIAFIHITSQNKQSIDFWTSYIAKLTPGLGKVYKKQII